MFLVRENMVQYWFYKVLLTKNLKSFLYSFREVFLQITFFCFHRNTDLAFPVAKRMGATGLRRVWDRIPSSFSPFWPFGPFWQIQFIAQDWHKVNFFIIFFIDTFYISQYTAIPKYYCVKMGNRDQGLFSGWEDVER